MSRLSSPARRLAGIALTALCGVGVLATAPALAAPGVLANTPWPMFGQNSKHTFLSPYVGPATANVLEVTNVSPYMNGQPAMTSDGMFIAAAGFATWGIRADGRLMWVTPVNDAAAWSSPAIDTEGNAFHGGRDNNLWSKHIPSNGVASCSYYIKSDSDTKSSPVFSVRFPGRIFMTSAFTLYTMNAASCQEMTGIKLDGFTMSSPSISDSVPGNGDSLGDLIAVADRYIYRLHENDDGSGLSVVTRAELVAQAYGASPMINPTTGEIYIGDTKKHFQKFAPDLSGRVAVNMPGRVFGTAALSPDHQTVYVLTHDGSLSALRADTLETRWLAKVRGNRYVLKGLAPVVDAAGTIYVGGTDKRVRAYNPDGSLKWEYKLAGSPGSVAITPGGLVVGDYKGKFYRFCPAPSGPPEATQVCGFVVDTTAP